MRKEIISNAITNISTEYIEKAADYTAEKRSRKPVWLKWGTIAACLALVAVLSVGVFQSGLLGGRNDTATLNNGEEIVFVRSGSTASSLDIGVSVTTRRLTEQELASLFPGLSVTARAVFGEGRGLIGLEGTVGEVKAVIATTDIALLDTKIAGSETLSEVDGTPVAAGYFEAKRNVIYYATFRLGECTVYLENSGARAESENIKNELAAVIGAMISNGTLDLCAISGS